MNTIRVWSATRWIAGLALLLLWSVTAAPTAAGAQLIEEPQGPYNYLCHHTGAVNHWVQNFPNSAGEFDGHMGASHQDGLDIIPPFEFNGEIFSQNWNPQGWTTWANGCVYVAPLTPVVPAVVGFTQASCDEPATLAVPADGGGVTYSISGTVEAGQVVTVTATIDGTVYSWGAVPAPWSIIDATTATQTIVFDVAPDCRETVVPEVPVILQATCTDPAAVLVPSGPVGVTYNVEGTQAAGETVTITATIDPLTHVWGTVSLPWVVVDAATVSFQVTFDVAPDCSTPTPTPTSTSTPSPTPTVEPGVTPTPAPTLEPGVTPTVTPAPTNTPVPTPSPTVKPTEPANLQPTNTPSPPKTVTKLPDTGDGPSGESHLWLAAAGLIALATAAAGTRKNHQN